MGRACNTHERSIYNIFLGKTHYEGLDVDGRIILKWVSEKWEVV
jgi:hypothetical protein